MAAGFDGIELHGANGYLLDQFLKSSTNERTDRYGGSIENRARLLVEVTDVVIAVWGAGRVGVRLSPGGGFNDMSDARPEDTFNAVVKQLSTRSLAYLHVVETLESVKTFDSKKLRENFEGLYIANAAYDFKCATDAITSGSADLVSFGQLSLANPDLLARFKKGAALNTPDPNTFYGGDEKGYIDYPSLDA